MSPAPECTQCHLLWLDDFATPAAQVLVPYRRDETYESGRGHAESSELMCYSCHDGYVADSRARTRTGFQHPMAGISRLGRERPRQLPLLREEQVYCGTCHTPHGPGHTSAPVSLEDNAFLRMAARPGPVGLCILCHVYDDTAGTRGNHIVANSEYALPEQLAVFHARPNQEEGGIGCQTCHDLHGTANPLLVILGGNDGSSPTLCWICHARDFSEQGVGPYSHPVGVRLDLEDPTPAYPNGERIRLSDSGTMNCLACHDVHESRVTDHLLRYAPPGSGICAACHADYAQTLAGTSHDLRVSAPEARNVAGQTAAQGGVCSGCHLAHKGRLPYLWARSPRGGRHPMERLCLSCHAVGGVASKHVSAALDHPTLVDKDLIRVRPDGTEVALAAPIYDEASRPAQRGWITCMTCHNAHRWRPGDGEPPAAEGNERPPPGEGTVLNSFLRYRSEDQICKHCHGVWGLWRYRYFHSPLRGKR